MALVVAVGSVGGGRRDGGRRDCGRGGRVVGEKVAVVAIPVDPRKHTRDIPGMPAKQ